MDSSFRWRDADLVKSLDSARALRAWVPAFAGMTVQGGPEASWGAALLSAGPLHPIPTPPPRPV